MYFLLAHDQHVAPHDDDNYFFTRTHEKSNSKGPIKLVHVSCSWKILPSKLEFDRTSLAPAFYQPVVSASRTCNMFTLCQNQ